jgi:EAL domain-containing protein (putative c-di-GMP-specific phosphodiesterase class I)
MYFDFRRNDVLFYLYSGEVYGAESLIRWLHPEKGLIPPLDFYPL